MGKRILVAEDEARISHLLKIYLERESFIVNVVDNGKDALDIALNEPCDLIILDILMPGKDGFTVLKEVRKTQSTPVILLSAKGEAHDLQRGAELGADEYILKPFSPKEVVEKIKTMLS
ncbi:response regulator [Bacillus sp. REN3]|uniref:response regulator transcription factor n=1 Tax=Bacillus sp. REN3 TaxID=2802440 RepID=UPI001AED918D|nr:response regulator [Bacillus sp. REN3]